MNGHRTLESRDAIDWNDATIENRAPGQNEVLLYVPFRAGGRVALY